MGMNNIKKMIKKRVFELGEEVSRLMQERDECSKRIRDIDTRLDQLAGAISELNKILHESQVEDEGDA